MTHNLCGCVLELAGAGDAGITPNVTLIVHAHFVSPFLSLSPLYIRYEKVLLEVRESDLNM